MLEKYMRVSLFAHRRALNAGWLGLIAVAAAMMPEIANATPFPPHTKIKLTVVQWMPTKGTYEEWASIGGEFTVSDTGTVSMPVLGNVPVGNLDESGLAAEIAKRLKDKIGLVEAPTAAVAILDYAPIYVVGDVNKPGEYKYNPTLTVLQALAMSGGEFRPTGVFGSSMDITRLLGEL